MLLFFSKISLILPKNLIVNHFELLWCCRIYLNFSNSSYFVVVESILVLGSLLFINLLGILYHYHWRMNVELDRLVRVVLEACYDTVMGQYSSKLFWVSLLSSEKLFLDSQLPRGNIEVFPYSYEVWYRNICAYECCGHFRSPNFI